MDWRAAVGVAARRNGLGLHFGSGSVNDEEKWDGYQRGTGGRVGVGFKVPGAREAILLMRGGLGMIVRMRRGKDDRDAEINQRQRQAENLLTHGR
jgi:hypothetical protein